MGFKIAFQGEGYRILTVGTSEVPLTIEEGSVSPKVNQAYPIFFTKDIENTFKKLQEQGEEVIEIKDDGDNIFYDFMI